MTIIPKYILVTIEKNNNHIPFVLEDYIYSLNIFDKAIHMDDFSVELYNESNDVYIFTQMWMQCGSWLETLDKSRIVFLNVEMLTEENRIKHIVELINHNIKIADYSITNIYFLIKYLHSYNIPYYNQLIYLPYQYNLRDQLSLENVDNEYTYDVGIINALPQQDESVDSSNTYRRTTIWNDLQKTKLKCLNILGWDKERDEQIKMCKVILNVHHFECFNVFEHIRCDRLIFAKKIIISDESLYSNKLDINNHIIIEKFDDLIKKTIEVVDNFDMYSKLISKLDTKSIIGDRRRILKSQIEKLTLSQFSLRSDIINSNLNDCENKRYLEIGIEDGYTFNEIKSIDKIGVDPDPKCDFENIIKKTSDEFFAENNQRFDCIFIDGMHQSDYVLRDFNNAIDILYQGGTIYFDDIFPINEREQYKIPIQHYIENDILKYAEPWTGDV